MPCQHVAAAADVDLLGVVLDLAFKMTTIMIFMHLAQRCGVKFVKGVTQFIAVLEFSCEPGAVYQNGRGLPTSNADAPDGLDRRTCLLHKMYMPLLH